MTDVIMAEASIYLEGSCDYLLSVVIIIIIRQWLDALAPSPLELCGGSRHILTSAKQAAMQGNVCLFVYVWHCVFLNC